MKNEKRSKLLSTSRFFGAPYFRQNLCFVTDAENIYPDPG